jgi:hypothetical protein
VAGDAIALKAGTALRARRSAADEDDQLPNDSMA